MFDALQHCFEVVVDVSLRVLVLAAVTGLVLSASRIRDSSVKHAVWLAVLVSLFGLPLLSAVIPGIPIPWPASGAILTSAQHDVVIDLVPLQQTNPVRNEDAQSLMVAAPSTRITPIASSETPAVFAPVKTPLRMLSWLSIIALAWGTGFVVLFVRLLLSFFLTRRLVYRSTLLQVDELPGSTGSAVLNGKRTPPRLRESSLIYVPLTTGCWRPNILLPVAWRTWSEDKLSHVLVHEFTHIRRRDCWTAIAVQFVVCLYWFHPFVWWLKQRLAALAEECCDDAAIGTTGNRVSYARHLLEIAAELNERLHRLNYAGLAMARRSQVELRILAILDSNRPLSKGLTWYTAMLIVAGLVPLMALAASVKPSTEATKAEAPNQKGVDNKRNARVALADHEKTPSNPDVALHLAGRITDAEGKPVSKAFVGVSARRRTDWHRWEALVEGIADEQGRYELSLKDVSVAEFDRWTFVVRAAGLGLGHKFVDLTQRDRQLDLQLLPEEPVRVRLVDIQGQPAENVVVTTLNVYPLHPKPGEEQGLFWKYSETIPTPKFVPTQLSSNDDGLLTIPHMVAGHGIYLVLAGNDRVAPHMVYLNSGMPESRLDGDGTYRGIIKNIPPKEVGVIVLAPAKIFEGTVFLGKSDQPAANAKVTMWASEQERPGSMVSIIGQTDEQGRFRLNPYPGLTFGITAFPPNGTAYQIHSIKDLKWESGSAVQRIDIRLPRGTMAKGAVVDAETGKPIPATSIQYEPDQAHNKKYSSDIVTGWQGIQLTDNDGKFQIPVLPGPGTLLISAPQSSSYIFEERGERQLQQGSFGGKRYYAHAFQTINPPEPAADTKDPDTTPEYTIQLKPGGTVSAKIVDSTGKPVLDAKYTSRLIVHPNNAVWRANFSQTVQNGIAELRGLKPGVKYPVFVLDAKRELGAQVEVSLDEPHPTIVLKPCATAKARFVGKGKEPVKNGLMLLLSMVVTPGVPELTNNRFLRATLAADEDFSSNFDRLDFQNHLTDENGAIAYRCLVPGTTYRFIDQGVVKKEFVAEPGKDHDLGNILLENY